MVNIKPIDNKLALGLLIISSNAVNAIVLVEGGRMVSIMSNKFSCSPSIGIYGIRENKTIIDGKNARKKLNAKDEALVVIAPWVIAVENEQKTSNMLKPFKP